MFSELFDSVPDALIVVDRSGGIVVANKQAERLFGYPRGDLAGMRVEALMPEGVRARHRTHQNAYMENPRVRAMGDTGQALTGQRLDGHQFPVEIALSPIVSGDGEMRFLASIRDVSESQRVRQAMVRAGYDTLVARIGQLALESADDESVIQAVPPLLAEALGVETLALVFMRPTGEGIDLRAAVGLPDDSVDSEQVLRNLIPSWRALASSGPMFVDNLMIQAGTSAVTPLEIASHAGVLIPLLDRDRPMGALIALSQQRHRFDHDALHLLQSVAHLLAALMQRRRSEEQLAHAQRLEAIGQLTGGVAHDFNNLLTIMSGSLQLLELEHPQRPEAAELIASALRSVARGAELTRKLLAFARRQRLNPQAIDVPALLRDVELMLRRTLGESIRLHIACDKAIAHAWADASQLDTALVNLALNARDAMPHGGELTLSASESWIAADDALPELPSGHYVVFSVADTGHGMSEGTLARAVEPFFTTKDMGRGSGLGLSMVYGFVRQSSGHMRFESELGYGTRVDLYLPVGGAVRDATTQATSSVAGGSGETVLLVEDEPAVRTISAAFLKSLGYRVHAVGNAADAIAWLETDAAIALLFSDVMLGDGMDGNQLAHEALRRRPGLAVLLTSGYEDSVARSEPGSDQRFELLRKPFRREQLAAAARRSLSQRDLRDQRNTV